MSTTPTPDPESNAAPAAGTMRRPLVPIIRGRAPRTQGRGTSGWSAGDRGVLAVAVLLLALQISPWYYSHGDGHAYISIARHLARGDGLKNMGSPVIWFPPGYPLLISPLFLFRDLPLLEISILQWLLAVGLAWGIYCWARAVCPGSAVWIAALTIGTNAVWIQYRRTISEIAFMAVMAWLLVSVDRLGDRRNVRLARARGRHVLKVDGRFLAWLIAAVGLTVAACLIRPVGLALAAGGSCALLSRAFRQGREQGARSSEHGAAGRFYSLLPARRSLLPALLISTAAAVTVGGVILRERLVAEPLGGETYLNSMDTKRGAAALAGYGPWCALVVSDIGRITVPFMFKCYGAIGAWRDWNMLVYVPVCGLLLSGYVRWMRGHHVLVVGDDPLAWSLPFYFAMLTCFRCESGARWWVPMAPALFMCLWFALEPLRRRREIVRTVWLLHVAAALAYWIGSDLPHTYRVNQNWPAVRCLAARVSSDRGNDHLGDRRNDHVAIDASLADIGELFTLALDRRVQEFAADGPIPPSISDPKYGARWLILPDGRVPPANFAPRASAAGCTLVERR
jgi:hypothetical protein